MKIKIGTILRDGWGRNWQAISYDKANDKWELRLELKPNHFYHYSTYFIQKNFQKISD